MTMRVSRDSKMLQCMGVCCVRPTPSRYNWQAAKHIFQLLQCTSRDKLSAWPLMSTCLRIWEAAGDVDAYNPTGYRVGGRPGVTPL
jgi:hypothetical protein